LPQLVRLRLPVLVVPHGSGNDFARALHLRSVDDALRAWRQFVSGRGSVRQVDLGVIAPPDAGGGARATRAWRWTLLRVRWRGGT
jgi:diacylglycerol kinase family enzyme